MSTEFSRALRAAVESNLNEPDTFWNPTQLDWKGRISITVGDAPEDLKCIPQLPENIVDKICLFKDMSNNNMATTPKTVIVGFYEVPDFGPDSVETPVVGDPKAQYAELERLIRARHPKQAKSLRRVGSVIEQRDGSEGFIEVPTGATIGQLFANLETGEAELSRTVGRVFMFGSPHDVVLVFLRAQGYVQVQLTPLLKGAGNSTTRYSNRLDPQRLADELPQLIKDVVGADARALTLKFRNL